MKGEEFSKENDNYFQLEYLIIYKKKKLVIILQMRNLFQINKFDTQAQAKDIEQKRTPTSCCTEEPRRFKIFLRLCDSGNKKKRFPSAWEGL